MNERLIVIRALLLALALVLPLGGCSTFERDWKAMGEAPSLSDAAPAVAATVEAAGMPGRWKGTWLSDVNGHGGGLRCIITPEDGGTYRARFLATYGRGLTFEYDLVMHVRREGETFHFSSEADLGWLAGGVYTYEGTVIGDDFDSTYECKSDRGTFEMTRQPSVAP